MAPLVVQIISTLIARRFVPWKDAARIGLAVMFLFTAATHFSSLKYDLAAMIPPPLTGALWVIYITGLLEMTGAVGLLTRSLRRPAAWGSRRFSSPTGRAQCPSRRPAVATRLRR